MVVIPRFERINYVIQEIYSVLHESTAFYTNLFRFAYILPRYDFYSKKPVVLSVFDPFPPSFRGSEKVSIKGHPTILWGLNLKFHQDACPLWEFPWQMSGKPSKKRTERNPSKRPWKKRTKSTSRYWKNTDEIWENRVFWKKKTVVNQDDNLHTHWWKEGWRKTTIFFSSKGNLGSKSFCREFLGAKVDENQRLGGGVSNVSFLHQEANIFLRVLTLSPMVQWKVTGCLKGKCYKVGPEPIVVNWVINGPCKLAFK